jgi:hypothetical protein
MVTLVMTAIFVSSSRFACADEEEIKIADEMGGDGDAPVAGAAAIASAAVLDMALNTVDLLLQLAQLTVSGDVLPVPSNLVSYFKSDQTRAMDDRVAQVLL